MIPIMFISIQTVISQMDGIPQSRYQNFDYISNMYKYLLDKRLTEIQIFSYTEIASSFQTSYSRE